MSAVSEAYIKLKENDLMYIRNWKKGQDNSALIAICVQNFDVPTSRIESILKYAHEVLIICHENGEIAGFLSYRLRINHMVLIDYVVLNNTFQRKGIARKLLPVFEKHVLNQGITTIYGMVDKENHQGIESFKRLGFETKGSFLTNYVIKKKLTPPHVNELVKPVSIEELKIHVSKLSAAPSLRRR
ncbi:MAG: GNAT family N-acetyltransferase [Anaerobacillus sp.]